MLLTKWGKRLDKNNPLSEYPRPQFVRDLNAVADAHLLARVGEALPHPGGFVFPLRARVEVEVGHPGFLHGAQAAQVIAEVCLVLFGGAGLVTHQERGDEHGPGRDVRPAVPDERSGAVDVPSVRRSVAVRVRSVADRLHACGRAARQGHRHAHGIGR